MFSSSLRNSLCANREVAKQLRNISKTSSSSKNEAISKKQNKNIRKWKRINEYNNKRALSTLQTTMNPKIHDITLGSEKESLEFNATFSEIIRDFLYKGPNSENADISNKVLKNENKRTGLTVLTAYKMLESPQKLTPENIRLANTLGWSVEFFHALLNEHSTVVNQKYLKDFDLLQCDPDVVKSMIKEENLIESTLSAFLEKHFATHPCYTPVVDLFHEITVKSSIGKAYEELFIKNGTPNLEMFTMQRYKTLVKYKTVLNSFVLPVTLAMFMAGKFDPEMHRQARTVLMEVGNFHQVRRDFLNVFGTSPNSELSATDIREGKCSWLAVVALQRGNPQQIKIMEANYGKSSDEAVDVIKQLYTDLGLPRTYETFEEESFKIARAHAHQISKGLSHTLFFQMIEKVFRREMDFTPN